MEPGLDDAGPRTVPLGSSEFQRALQEVMRESEHHSNGTCRVTIQTPGDTIKAQHDHHHHHHRQEDRFLQGKEHCYRLHHGNVLPSYSHHRPPSNSKSSSPSSRSPSISPSRSPVSPRRHPQGQKGSPPLALRMRELSVEETGPMSRQRSNSDCVRHPARSKQHAHSSAHPHHAHSSHDRASHRSESHSHSRDHMHLHPHSHSLHVHWPDSAKEGRLDEPRTRSLSFGAVDGMRKPSKSILKHADS